MDYRESERAVKHDPKELLTIDELSAKLKMKKSFFYTPYHRKGPDAILALQEGGLWAGMKAYAFFIILQMISNRLHRQRKRV